MSTPQSGQADRLPDQYHNTTWTFGKNQTHHIPGEHTLDITSAKGLAFLDDAVKAERPFFLMVAPVAPHVEHLPNGLHKPPPQKKWARAFKERHVPRNGNFNPIVVRDVTRLL